MRFNTTYTPTALSPVNLATGTTLAPAAKSQPVYATRVMIQALHGATVGLVYVMDGVGPVGRVPAISSDVPCELSAATSTAPGGVYSDQDPAGAIDIRTIWIDVAVSSTPVRASIDLKV